jgi:hypothetical protein
MTWVDVFQWFTLVVLWCAIFVNLRDVRRRRKQDRLDEAHYQELARLAGVTPLQAQVAMDAAAATFYQRVHEMRKP